MAKIRPLKNPPVSESVVDFRAVLPAAFKLESFRALQYELKPRFPRMEEMRQFKAGVSFTRGSPPMQSYEEKGTVGYRFWSQTGEEIMQFQLNGFTFSRLKPYTDWQQVRDRFLEGWEHYRRTASPERVTRIAVRYINRIDFVIEARGLLTGVLMQPPKTPPGFQGDLKTFMDRTVTTDPADGTTCIVTRASEPGLEENRQSLLLDIDVFCTGTFTCDPTELKPILERLRERKNGVFFSSLKDAVVRRYDS